MDWIKDNPFKNYKGKTLPTVKSILNFDDIRLIEEYESMSDSKNIVKDLFLFMSYTGLSYGDLNALTKNDIQLSINGNNIIKISRKKTREYCMIPLISKAETIINKYNNHPKVLNSILALPVISNQKINQYLLEIQKELKDKLNSFKNINYKESIEEAIKSIPVKENDIILITGSLYLAGEVLNLN